MRKYLQYVQFRNMSISRCLSTKRLLGESLDVVVGPQDAGPEEEAEEAADVGQRLREPVLGHVGRHLDGGLPGGDGDPGQVGRDGPLRLVGDHGVPGEVAVLPATCRKLGRSSAAIWTRTPGILGIKISNLVGVPITMPQNGPII